MSRTRTLQESLSHAAEGILYALKTQRNMRLLAATGALIMALGVVCGVEPLEWLFLGGAIAALLFAELMNTAIEVFADHITGGSQRADIKHMKDIAAGAVLVTVINAAVVSTVIFLPYLRATPWWE